MLRSTHLSLFFMCISVCSGVIYDMNATEYEKMPPKFFMDPYDICISQPDGLYCSMDLTLVSDSPSNLLDIIVEYSSLKLRHFNYTKLYRGVCLTQNCKKYYLNSNNTKANLKVILEECLNDTLWTNYKLKAKITNEIFCDSANDSGLNVEAIDIAVAVICLSLVLVNVIGSLYDFLFTTGKSEDGLKLLLCFSLRRNWRKLVVATADGSDLRIKRLKGLIGLRTIFICFVIIFHSLYIPGFGTENPRFSEKTYDYIASFLVYNGHMVVQIFFIISGFLLAYNLQIFAEKEKITWVTVPKGILAGIVRLTPPYAIVLALICTWMRFAGSGPMWEKIMGAEINDCRRYWWSHVLYFSNYIEGSHCMLQSWYVAADFHMYCLSLIIFCTFQNNRSRKLILTVLLLAGVLIPAVQTYIQDLDAVLLLTPEYPMNYATNIIYNTVYRNTHTNFACYVLGLGLGFLVYHWQNNGFNVQIYKLCDNKSRGALRFNLLKVLVNMSYVANLLRCFLSRLTWADKQFFTSSLTEKYTIIYWALFPASAGVVLSGAVFYSDDVQYPVIIRAAYAGLAKPVFGFLVSCIILGMIFKLENFYRGVVEWRGWAAAGRVSYCAYLVHFTLIRHALGIRTTIIRTTLIGVIEANLYILVMSYVAAVPLFLLVENPTRQLLKVLLGHKKSGAKTNIEE